MRTLALGLWMVSMIAFLWFGAKVMIGISPVFAWVYLAGFVAYVVLHCAVPFMRSLWVYSWNMFWENCSNKTILYGALGSACGALAAAYVLPYGSWWALLAMTVATIPAGVLYLKSFFGDMFRIFQAV